MTLNEYIEEIKLELTGGILDLEIPDETIGKLVTKALREIQRFIDTTEVIMVPFAKCIDLQGFRDKYGSTVSSVTKIYRTKAYTTTGVDIENSDASDIDPFQAQMWQIFSNNGSMYNLQNYMLNYMSYNTLLGMRSATSTDLAFKEVHNSKEHKLYINIQSESPNEITIEYVPKIETVEAVTSDYWIDILQRLSIAFTKVTLGRIRTRYTQSNALWTQDGEKMLEEGNTELANIRETLRVNALQFYPVD